MNKILRRAIALSGLLVALAHVQAQADQLADIQAHGTLTCGVLDTFEPFSYIDSANRILVGYDVDVCEAVARRLNVRAEIRPVSIEARIPELQRGRMDLLAAGLAYTAQRAAQVDFSDIYYVSENVLAVKASRGYASRPDLSGKRISYVKGGIAENYLNEVLPTASVVGFEDTPTAFTALVQGKVDAVSTSEEVLRKLISKLGPSASQFAVLHPAVGREYWGLGVRKNEAGLLAAVNGALQAMEASGEIQAIFDKWLGMETLYQMKRPYTVEPIPR
ncbi:ABC transporter substrate-binding protein [Achromobacter sp. Marseille-Q0513]|uniref:ABC transporter substrate-binding protein n=1 Tax=Achromobacter sp. Marseille-Q0513 TaxID=2829161 RepID=UPI001B9B3360|nr:ABC transporter substrate-binding protein [Achromobacter sp. Marseille-Q0513]MBR8655459.1 ABC transporter substrate-binding protein [Achromobacter sp. Marseille-Q0513]